MRGGLTVETGAAARSLSPWPLVAAAPLALAVLAGDGSSALRLSWIGLVALAALGALAVAWALGLVAARAIRLPGALLLAALVALVAWQGVSVAWSIEGDRTWDTFNRGLVYVAFVALGWLAVAAAGALRPVAAALGALLAAAVVWSLVTVVLPGLGPDTERSARLQEPVGYWNGLALLVALSLPLWLWLATRREHAPRLRAAGVALLFLALVALALTVSRGGLLAAAAAVAIWLLVARPRLESAAALALAGVPAVVVSGFALGATVLVDAGALTTERRAHGAILGLLLLGTVAGLVVATQRLVRLSPSDPLRRRLGRGVLAAGAVAAVLAVVAALVAVDLGEAWDDFRNPPQEQLTVEPGRVAAVSSNHRWTWWTQAWELFRAKPWGGWGAGSYELARRPIREDTIAPLDPHDLPLAALAETGVVGLVLLLAAVAGGAWVAVAAVRRLGDGERAAAVALAAGAGAWLVQSLVDMPWQYVAVSAPLFFALGALAAAGRPERPRPAGTPVLAAAAAAATLAGLAFSLASPAVAELRTDAAYDALVTGEPEEAAELARSARSFDPLAVEPVIVQASAEEIRGNLDEAERLFRHAVELQPRNPDPWYELGRFEFESLRRLEPAFAYADRSFALDPRPPTTGELLDEIRAAMEARLEEEAG